MLLFIATPLGKALFVIICAACSAAVLAFLVGGLWHLVAYKRKAKIRSTRLKEVDRLLALDEIEQMIS